MKLLVTSASGYLGQHLLLALHAAGHELRRGPSTGPTLFVGAAAGVAVSVSVSGSEIILQNTKQRTLGAKTKLGQIGIEEFCFSADRNRRSIFGHQLPTMYMYTIVQHMGVLHTVADEAVSMSSASSTASIAAT